MTTVTMESVAVRPVKVVSMAVGSVTSVQSVAVRLVEVVSFCFFGFQSFNNKSKS